MAGYAILRVQKLKSLHGIRRSFLHSYREQETPNADKRRLEENESFGAKSTEEATSKLTERLPEKIRKNAVLCVEHLVTASPEWFEDKSAEEQKQYFDDSIEWLREKYGSDNVICGGIHNDETTPHAFVYVVPLDESTGRLNCRKWLGERNALSDMQTNFHAQVAEKYGLERGVKGSKAKHKSIKKYYTDVNQAEKSARPSVPSKSELLKAAAGVETPNFKLFKRFADFAPSAIKFASASKEAAERAKNKLDKVLAKIAKLESKVKQQETRAELAETRANLADARARNLQDKTISLTSENKELLQLRQQDQMKISTYKQKLNSNKDSVSRNANKLQKGMSHD